MKKSLFLSMFACAALALSGCGDKPNGNGGFVPDDSGDDGTGDGSDDGNDGTGSDGGGSDGTGGNDDPTGGDGTGTGDGGSFIQQPDGGGQDMECDVWAQDCEAGEKCMPWANDGGSAWNATKCSTLDPSPAQPGDTCTVEGSGVSGEDSCDVAAMCWDVDPETNEGVCIAFCTGSDQNPVCDDPDTSCSITNEGVLILCLPTCDPLLQDCAEGQACYAITDGTACVPDASGEDAGIAGDPCEFINACDPGLGCVSADYVPGCAGSLGCCAPFCDVDNASCDVGAGEECVPVWPEGEAPPGFETLGQCSLPP